MKLTLQTDHALRILMALAEADGAVLSVEELAERFRVSRNHLMKTAQALAAGGFVFTLRGRNGGLRLAREASAITIAEVVSHVEPDMNIAECFHKPGCTFLPSCKLRGLLASARSAFLDTLAGRTLADIITTPGRPALPLA